MAKYRVLYKPNKLYEGLVQKKVFNCFWWTIEKYFFPHQAQDALRKLKRDGPSYRVLLEMEF